MVLFPHTFITAGRLKGLFERFRQLESFNPEVLKKINFVSEKKLLIFQPWHMEDPWTAAEIFHEAKIDFIRPSIHLKPDTHFKTLLTEYKQWMIQNPYRDYTGFNANSGFKEVQEESGWEIRHMVRNSNRENLNKDTVKKKALKWHLVLHLAKGYEENQLEAKKILDQIKEQESPLHQAVEAPRMNKLFEDLPNTEEDLFIDGPRLRQIFEAWFGLFEELVPHDAIFITFHRPCLNYIMNTLEDAEIDTKTETIEISSEKEESNEAPIILTHFPGFSKSKDNTNISFLTPFSNKTLFFINL
jgi:hypothetical protein